MIDVRELRFGNSVLINGSKYTVTGILDDQKGGYSINAIDAHSTVVFEPLSNCFPIEINKEILSQIGFSETDTDFMTLEVTGTKSLIAIIAEEESTNYTRVGISSIVPTLKNGLPTTVVEIEYFNWKYLHQIQNIYYALRLEELF